MNIRFISDLHFGHKKIREYSQGFRGEDNIEHNEWLVQQWNSVVSKQDVTWVLGDVAFNKHALNNMSRLNGIKHLILGNHDKYPIAEYQKFFNKIHGFMRFKGFWLSHAPIRDLRGRYNIHGHTHGSKLVDGNYVCVCVEALNGMPVTLEEIQEEISR